MFWHFLLKQLLSWPVNSGYQIIEGLVWHSDNRYSSPLRTMVRIITTNPLNTWFFVYLRCMDNLIIGIIGWYVLLRVTCWEARLQWLGHPMINVNGAAVLQFTHRILQNFCSLISFIKYSNLFNCYQESEWRHRCSRHIWMHNACYLQHENKTSCHLWLFLLFLINEQLWVDFNAILEGTQHLHLFLTIQMGFHTISRSFWN